MIELTESAAEQIRKSAREGNMMGMPLRIAVQKDEEGAFHYAMGFDDKLTESDMKFESHGIDLVVAPVSQEMLNGTRIDFVTLDDGNVGFIFLNPQDPNCKDTASE